MKKIVCLSLLAFVGTASALDIDALCPPRPETAAPFTPGDCPPAALPYRQAAERIYAYMTALPAMTELVEKGVLDRHYQHNAYVSKTQAAHITAMLNWAKVCPARRAEALRFAKASAEYLLSQLEPANAPLAFWPPTYGRSPLPFDPKTDGDYRKPCMVGNEPEGAVKYRGEVMLIYPADVGSAFVDYFRETGDRRFLDAALGIARTYLKTRRADDGWPLKMVLETGASIGENTLVPTRPLVFFEKLFAATRDATWRQAADRCFAWLEAHPLKDWNWDGQFEDIRPAKPYQNPTKHNAIDAMLYILNRFPGDRARLETCRKILEFCEKRFVVWKAPKNHPKWPAPSVLEQYSCFTPIDASAAKMIRAYLAMYRAEGREEDLAKAKALANSMTRVQEKSGRVPTFWEGVYTGEGLTHVRYDWLNCMAASANALLQVAEADRWERLNAQARAEALAPVRPGEPGKAPFWNAKARAFMHPPAFDFKETKGAAGYRFTLSNGANWLAEKPWAVLDAAVWNALKPGEYTLKVEGLDRNGVVTGLAGTRTFHRAAVFRGPYPASCAAERGAEDVAPYRAAAERVYAAVYRAPYVQKWLTSAEPPEGYDLYCYPAKILSAMITALCRHAANEPKEAANALAIARKMADWLIAHSQKAGSPLEFFPPTYWGNRREVAVRYAGQNMLSYPAQAAKAYLALGGPYREAAIRLARTYLKLQGADGTWPLKVSEKDGKSVRTNRLVPDADVLDLLDRAYALTGDEAFRRAGERAFAYVMNGPCKTWNWDGQFEDVDPLPPYSNLEKSRACDTATRLLLTGGNRALARALIDWSEDQFVVWSDPVHNMDWRHWKTPTALEQYEYYTPIDASMADLIGVYATAYRVLRTPLDLAKAKALADNILRHQRPDGTVPTYFDSRKGSDWVNCMVAVAGTLEDLADAEESCGTEFACGAWKVQFDAARSRLVLTHGKSGAKIAGTLSFTGPEKVTGAGTAENPERTANWKVVDSRDGAKNRLALADPRDRVHGYVTFQDGGDRLSLLVYHRTAFAYGGELRFEAEVDYRPDAFACRVTPRAGDRVLSIRSGRAVTENDDALFSAAVDEALVFGGGNVRIGAGVRGASARPWTVGLALKIDDAASASASFEIKRDYYKSRWVPYYRPLDRSRAPHAPTGWLSWNTYFDQAGSKENLDEARFAAKWFKPFGMEIWNIESWQDNSDHLPVSKFYNMNLETYGVQFPEGMKWLADEIRKLGFKPGLWMAPYGTGSEKFYREHTDWFLHDENGKPLGSWNGRYTLDPTAPGALEHLTKIFDKASHEWGYEFFKIDGMSGRGPGYCAHMYEMPDVRARFHDPTCPNPFERTVAAFRKGIGDDRIFLACQGHFTGAEAAYADSSRTGADIVHPNQPVKWNNILLQARCTVNQFFAHSIVFWSDPDCMLISQGALQREQAQVETTVVALPGQQTFAGDKLAELAPDRVRLIQQALPVCDTHPGKLYPMFGHLNVWDLKVARPFGEWHVVGLFNWSDKPEKIGVDWAELGERAETTYLGWEFWSGTWLGERKGRLEMEVPPRAVRLVALQPKANHPQFLSSERHVTQGGVELKDQTWNGKALSATVNVIGGFPTTVRFALPEGCAIANVAVEGAKFSRTLEQDGRVLAVRLWCDRTVDAVIRLSTDFGRCLRTDSEGDAKEIADLRSRTEKRIAEIRSTPNLAVPKGAPCRYLSSKSGDDSANGLTPGTAWKTTERLNREKLPPGSFVLFERGGLYRNGFKAREGVTYTAYGTGAKPRIYASPENGANPAKWTKTDAENVWAYQLDGRDVGTIVFDEGAAHAIKILPVYRGRNNYTQQYGGAPFNRGYHDLKGDLHFWHDYSDKTDFKPFAKGTGKIYLVSKENPGKRFKSIEFNVRQHGVGVAGGNVHIDNLCIMYVGSHGVGSGTVAGLTVSNCEFAWIGGSVQAERLFGRSWAVRFGNAVEIYGACTDYTVTNCYVHEVYDAGLTHQSNWHFGNRTVMMKNVRYVDNVIERCNYSIEYFFRPPEGNPSGMDGYLIERNLCWDAGTGFCEQRPDCTQGAHVKGWRNGCNPARGFVIRNNVFARSHDMLVEVSSQRNNPDGTDSMPVLKDNVFVGRSGQRFGVLNQGKSVEYRYERMLP